MVWQLLTVIADEGRDNIAVYQDDARNLWMRCPMRVWKRFIYFTPTHGRKPAIIKGVL